MTAESDQSPDTEIETPMMTRFEEMDYFSKALKYDAKMFGLIAAFSGISLTVLSGFEPNMNRFFDFDRIPLWALIVGPLVSIAAVAVSYHLCKIVDRRNAAGKTSYRKQMKLIAAQAGREIDDSGSEPFFK